MSARVLAAGLALLTMAGAPPAHRWETYANPRFGYSLCYPADMLEPQGEADNGDGRAFLSRDGAQLKAWGQYNALDRTLGQAMAAERRRLTSGAEAGIEYAAAKANWFVLSGHVGDEVLYLRSRLAGDRFVTFELRYPALAAARWNPVAARLSSCFKAN